MPHLTSRWLAGEAIQKMAGGVWSSTIDERVADLQERRRRGQRGHRLESGVEPTYCRPANSKMRTCGQDVIGAQKALGVGRQHVVDGKRHNCLLLCRRPRYHART